MSRWLKETTSQKNFPACISVRMRVRIFSPGWRRMVRFTSGYFSRKRFREKYPEVNLTILRQPGEKIRTRILTEMHAGKFFWDVVSFNHLDMDALASEGLLATYASPETRGGFPA